MENIPAQNTNPVNNVSTTPAATATTPTPSAAPVIPTPPAAAQVQTPTPVAAMEFFRYPMLKSMVNIFRLLAIVFLGVALLLCLIQLIIGGLTTSTFGNILFYLGFGFFQAVVCFTLAEGITVLLDIEEQTRPASVDAELKKANPAS